VSDAKLAAPLFIRSRGCSVVLDKVRQQSFCRRE
jgi:hypothetical protein